jgi:nucleotide-binding universal stress UspA family protein
MSTMRIVLGVDEALVHENARLMLERLDFERAEILETNIPRKQADPAKGLVDAALVEGAELVAVGSRGISPIKAMVIGSVGRGLMANCPRSLLIAKGDVGDGPVRAVFAYDGSSYADKCLELLIELRPRGLAFVRVVCIDANTEADFEALREGQRRDLHPPIPDDLARLRAKADAAADALRAAGFDADAVTVVGEVNPTLREAVADTSADLLIMGAQGHGFVERTLFGSVSFHQACNEKHSVLVLRPWRWTQR